MAEKNQDHEKQISRNNFETVMHSLLKEAGAVLTSKTVIGEPIEVGETLLIPLSDVTVGAAAGANNGEGKNAGMGGFTAKMSPSAVLIIKNGREPAAINSYRGEFMSQYSWAEFLIGTMTSGL